MQILIEFTPTGFYYLFHCSPAPYSNELFNLTHFLPDSVVNKLIDQLHETNDAEVHIDQLQEFLTGLSFQALPFCDYIEDAILLLNKDIGKHSIREISERINKSERQFTRQFSKMVGVSPKLYSKLLQLHYVINLMNLKSYSTLKEISYSANFYDPSHFDRRFKELVGISPNEFLVSKEHNALKYFTGLVKTRQ